MPLRRILIGRGASTVETAPLEGRDAAGIAALTQIRWRRLALRWAGARRTWLPRYAGNRIPAARRRTSLCADGLGSHVRHAPAQRKARRIVDLLAPCAAA